MKIFIEKKKVKFVMSCYYRVMLTNALRTLVNNQFLKKFDTTFMKNKKKMKKILS